MKNLISVCVSFAMAAFVAAGAEVMHNHNDIESGINQNCPFNHQHNHPHGENVDKYKRNAISGHVFEYGTHEEIAYATIYVVEAGHGASAGDCGEFFIDNLEDGKYTLRVQCMGYSSKEVTVTLKNRELKHIDVELNSTSVQLDDVVVTASRNAVRRCEAPVVVNILNQQLFEKTNSTDLAQSLNYQSGLRVENSCQNCAFPQVRINGLEGPYSQVLINSRPVVSALSGVYALEQLPVNMIDRIEVVRGGGSALFGANAVGGTINIITTDPLDNSFSVGTTLSNMNGDAWEEVVNANASLVSENKKYGIALYETYRNRSPYDANGDGFSEVGKLNLNLFGFNAYYRPSEFGRLNIEYHTTNEFRRGGNKFDLEPFQTDITEQTSHIINSGGVNYVQSWNDYKHRMSLYTSVQDIDRNSYYGAQQNPDAYGKTDDLTWVVGGTYTGQYNKVIFAPATFTAGLEYQSNSMHDVMVGYNRDKKQDVQIFGAFVQNEWKMKYFTLLAGLRLDNHNLIDNPIVSPRVNLMYKPTDKFQARLTWSTGFRAPQAYDEDLHITAVGGEATLIRLAEGLKPERSNSFSGSVDWVCNIGHWQANLLVEGFYTTLNDVFVLEDKGFDEQGNAIKERRNGSGANVFGANVDFKIAHGKDLALQLGATWQRSLYKEAEQWSEDPNVAPTKNMMRTPNLYGYFTLSGSPFRNFDWALSGVYTGRMYVPHYAPSDVPTDDPFFDTYITQDELVYTPDFFDFNVKFNYTIPLTNRLSMQVNAGVKNIFNAFQKDLDSGGYRDSGYFYGPTAPRTYFAGVKFTM